MGYANFGNRRFYPGKGRGRGMSDVVLLTKRLVEQMTAIRDSPGGFLRFRFEEGDEIQPRAFFKEGRRLALINWTEWLYRDGTSWWDATLTDAGRDALAAFEGTPPVALSAYKETRMSDRQDTDKRRKHMAHMDDKRRAVGMSDMTPEKAQALLDGATPGPWLSNGEPWNLIVWSAADNRVCFMAHSNGLDDDRDVATAELVAAAPDLARAYIAQAVQLEAAQALLAGAEEMRVSNMTRIDAELTRLRAQLAEARNKALEEAAVAGGDAAVDMIARDPGASPLRLQLARQAIAKAIRNLKGPTP
jgi:hypothetical protein